MIFARGPGHLAAGRSPEHARYDRLRRAIDAQVQQGDLAAIDRALRASKARRELWGLDAAVEIKTDLSPGMARLMQIWQELRDVPPPPQALPEPSYDVEGEMEPALGHLPEPPVSRGENWSMLD